MKVQTHFKQKKHVKLTGPAYTDLRKEVAQRDNYTYQNPYCEHGYPLDSPHHVKKRSQGGKNLSCNLILLCVPCHDKIHARGTLKVTGEYPNFKFERIEK